MTNSDDGHADLPKQTPSKPALPKAKPGHGGPATKADHAALKRVDKTVIKRMRKR